VQFVCISQRRCDDGNFVYCCNLPKAFCDGSSLLGWLRVQNDRPDWLLHLMRLRVSLISLEFI
jgi:hypothetical protein